MERRTRSTAEEGGASVLTLLKCLLASYLITGVLLLLLALLLYKLSLNEKVVSIAIIVIYVAATFIAGFLAGKRFKTRKFLWGFLVGSGYFLVLLILSLMMNAASVGFNSGLLTTYILCAGGGMLGGMVS